MASESVQAKPPAPAQTARLQHRCRLRFQKSGDLRLVSHIDLLHVFERLLRRAEVPFAFTQGFHPKPNLVFAQALALGVVGLCEVVDLELREPVPAEEILNRLNRQAPPGLLFLNATLLNRKSSLAVRRAFYRLPLRDEAHIPVGGADEADRKNCPKPPADLPERCAALLAQPRCVVERLRPQRRLIDIRPYFCDIAVAGAALTMALWITPDGAARPEEVVRALGLSALLDAGAVLERTHLELMEDLPAAERWLPPIPRLDSVAIQSSEIVAVAAETPPAAASHEALVENPMSYET